METLNEWVAEKADFQMQASKVKHGFTRKKKKKRKIGRLVETGQQQVAPSRRKWEVWKIVRRKPTRRK